MNSFIDGGAGADLIANSAKKATLNGGAGDDEIYTEGRYSYIDGGDGNDTIYAYAHDATVTGGLGNDVIDFGGLSGVYNYLGGDDTIYGAGSDDLIVNVDYDFFEQSGDNLIFHIGDHTLTLMNQTLE